MRELKRRLKVRRSQADGLAAGVGIGYVRDENGKLVKKKAAQSDDIYVTDENGELVPYEPPGPRRFTEEDQERCDRTRDQRHTRSWFTQELLKIAEGRVKVTREQYQALVAFGKARGFNTKRSPGRR